MADTDVITEENAQNEPETESVKLTWEDDPPKAEPVEVTEENFQSLLENDRPLLVDFWAQWCAPCKRVEPLLDELAQEYQGRLTIGKLDVDQQRSLAAKFQVLGMPTFILFKDGEIVEQMRGIMSKSAFQRFIDKNLDAAPDGAAPADATPADATPAEADAAPAAADAVPADAAPAAADAEPAGADAEPADTAVAETSVASVDDAAADADAAAADAARASAEAAPADAAAG